MWIRRPLLTHDATWLLCRLLGGGGAERAAARRTLSNAAGGSASASAPPGMDDSAHTAWEVGMAGVGAADGMWGYDDLVLRHDAACSRAEQESTLDNPPWEVLMDICTGVDVLSRGSPSCPRASRVWCHLHLHVCINIHLNVTAVVATLTISSSSSITPMPYQCSQPPQRLSEEPTCNATPRSAAS